MASFAVAIGGVTGVSLYTNRTPDLAQSLKRIQRRYSDCINPDNQKGVFDELNLDEFEAEIKQILKDAKQADDTVIGKANLFAIGDVHADYATYIKLVFAAGLIDRNGVVIESAWDSSVCKFMNRLFHINPKGKSKKLVNLGDIITSDGRRYPKAAENGLKAYLFILSLQEQAKNKGLEVINIVGNHEQDFLFSGKDTKMTESLIKVNGGFTLGQQLAIQQALKEDIENGRFQLALGENKRNLFFTHAGLEKVVLVESVKQILTNRGIEIPEELQQKKEYTIIGKNKIYVRVSGYGDLQKGDDLPVRIIAPKIKTKDLYRIMNTYNITPEDISEHMNAKFKYDVSRDFFREENTDNIERDPLYASGAMVKVKNGFTPVATTNDRQSTPPAFLIEGSPSPYVPYAPTSTSVMWTNKKLFRSYLGSKANLEGIKPYKMLNFVGHHPRFFLKKLLPGDGAIAKLGNTFVVDYGGGFEVFINPNKGIRDMKGLQGAGLIAIDDQNVFSIEYNYDKKDFERYDETGVRLPSNNERIQSLAEISQVVPVNPLGMIHKQNVPTQPNMMHSSSNGSIIRRLAEQTINFALSQGINPSNALVPRSRL